MMRGSVEMFYFSGVKTETDRYGNFIDSTTSKSVLCITASNTAFDGDETNIFVPLDKEMHAHYQRLEPHLCTLDLNKPWSVSRNVGLMSPQLATLCNWLHRTDKN